MNEKYRIAGHGLRTMFTGELLGLAGMLLAWVPVVGGLLIVVGGVMGIVGLCKAMPAHEHYKKAVLMLAAGVVVGVVSSFLGDGPVAGLVGALGGACHILRVYYVCSATVALLRERADERTAGQGALVWKVNAVCYLVVIAASILMLFLPALGMAISLIGSLAGIAASVIFVLFLFSGQRALQD